MIIRQTSVISGIERTKDIPANPEDFMIWQSGNVSIDAAMPYLNSADREFILSGITQTEWSEFFQTEGELC
jgi:hypothetical protein